MFSMGIMNHRSVFVIAFLISLFLHGELGAQTNPHPGAAQYTVRQSAAGLTVSFSFDELAIAEPAEQIPGGALVQIPGVPMNFEPGRPLLPVIALPIALPQCNPAMQIQVQEVVEYRQVEPLYCAEAQNPSGKETQSWVHFTEKPGRSMAKGQIIYPAEIADLAELGRFRDYLISRLRVFPVQVTPGGMRFFKKFTVSIAYQQLQPVANAVLPEDAAILGRLVINDRQLHLIASLPAVPGGENKAPANTVKSVADPVRRDSWLRNSATVAEYLIITHPDLWNQAEMLKSHRERQGIAAALVDVHDIYDEFNHGIESPLAIQHFLTYAFYHWARRPRLKYVVLLGAARAKSATFVPAFLMKSRQGEATATDLPYALVSGDDVIPDLFVGRLPATSPREAWAAVSKIIEYEMPGPLGPWRNQALFVADGAPLEVSGVNSSEAVGRVEGPGRLEPFSASWLPDPVSLLRLHAVPNSARSFDSPNGPVADLINFWNEGVCLIDFFGSSHDNRWTKNERLTPADVEHLYNKGKYPVVMNMPATASTALSGTGVAEALVLAAERGAIGVITTADRGTSRKNAELPGYIGRFLWDGAGTVGEALQLGRIYFSAIYPETGEAADAADEKWDHFLPKALYQSNLLGDPLIRLPFVAGELSIALNSDLLQCGDTLEVTVWPPLVPASGYIELADGNLDIVNRLPLFDVTSPSRVKFPIGPNFFPGEGVIRAYLSDGTRDFRSSTRFVVNQAAVTAFELHPPRPRADDTVGVRLQIRERYGISRVQLFPQGASEGIPAVPDLQNPGYYTARLAPSNRSGRVTFDIAVENKPGKVSIIPDFSFPIRDYRPDIAPVKGSLRLTGIKKAALALRLSNAAGGGINGTVKVTVHFAHRPEDLIRGNFFATAVGEMGANDSVEVSVPYPFPLTPAPLEIFALARVDPSENVADFNPANDTLHTVLQPDIFTVFPDREFEVTLLDGRYRVKFPPGCLTDTAAVRIRTIQFAPPADQPALQPVPFTAPGHFYALEVNVLNPAARLRLPLAVQVGFVPVLFDTSRTSFSNITLFGKSDLTQPWISTLFSASLSTGEINAALQQGGLFAPFVSKDRLPPTVELSMNGRTSSRPGAIHLQLKDEGGLNLQREKIRVTIDGTPLPENQMHSPAAFPSNKRLEMTLFPELGPGTHQVQVETEDIYGNAIKREYAVTVAQQTFDLIVYGNYPNPFSDRTVFAYFVQVADELDDFEIRIYSVSGQLIRRINADINNAIDAPDGGAKRKGYNEIIWDGTDTDGNLVRNGVYFAIIRAVYQGDTIEKILKVAKLR